MRVYNTMMSIRTGAGLFVILLLFTWYCEEVRGQNSPDLYLRAPDVVPGTLPEMRTVSYWTDKMEHPDQVVMTPAQIERMNRNYRQKMTVFTGLDSSIVQHISRQLRFSPGLVTTEPDLGSMTPAEISAVVRDIVDRQIQNLRRRSYGNRLGVRYSDSEVDTMVDEMAHDSISDNIATQPGITAKNSRLRVVPSIRPEYVGLSQTGKTRWDLWNLDIVPIGSPVRILHVSKTGAFLFVLSERGYGWIGSENIATGSGSEIESFAGAGDFIVTTGDRVPFYSDSNATYVSGWMRMGDRLPLADSDNPRQIKVPVRQVNGEFSVQEAWLAPDADVNLGYLSYTRRNVVVQVFKLLDTIYDWTGGWFGRNHATILRDIFSTFGFEMPSNGVFLSHFNTNTEIISSELDEETKYKTIFANEPFITFQTSNSGHSQLYLGEHEGQAIVFDTHGYGYENDDGEMLELRRSVVGTLTLPSYMLEQDLILTVIK